jgi:hypothetical protein
MHIDHINHNTLDNRKENLRICTFNQNAQNRRGKNKNNSSGHRNVTLSKGNYIVQLQINGKNKCFLITKNYSKACEVADRMRKKYYGEFAGESL